MRTLGASDTKKRDGYMRTLKTRKSGDKHMEGAAKAVAKYHMLKDLVTMHENQLHPDYDYIRDLQSRLHVLRARIRNGRYSDAEI